MIALLRTHTVYLFFIPNSRLFILCSLVLDFYIHDCKYKLTVIAALLSNSECDNEYIVKVVACNVKQRKRK